MLSEILKIQNGDRMVDYLIYECNKCNTKIEEAWPHYEESRDYHLCTECAFREGKITAKKYLDCTGAGLGIFNVAIDPDGEIAFWLGSKIPPWERTDKQQRNSPKYKEWRAKVFERDNYTCQECKQRGGILNAHHIKSFKDFPHLRYELDNGVTLCKKCHKEKHRKKGE